MIPKLIHYCWFGKGEKTKLSKRCIASWKKYCPDYEIIEWNEENFDVNQYPYLKWCCENQKWAFLSDFVRLLVVYRFGGIYFDVDVELLKKTDELMELDAFYGFEDDKHIATGLGFGAVAGHRTLEAMIELYLNPEQDENGSFQLVKCPELNTSALLSLGLVQNGECQNVCGAKIFSKEFFNPYDDATGCLKKSENTISIHWYAKSWVSKKNILRSKITKPFHRMFGKHCFDWLKILDR